jgi:ADP-heptose:LPS heptosyltransferase/GT2 family glycosyltransferase
MRMGADIPDTETNPRPQARIPFRRRLAAASPGPDDGQPASLSFAAAASAPGSDRDVLMGYQIFLGRDPENSHVMVEAKANPLRGFIMGLVLSGEFESAVLQPLSRRLPMPHEQSGAGPAPEQIAWVNTIMALPPSLSDSGLTAPGAMDWRGFWTAMLAVPGFPRGAAASAAMAGTNPALAADDGFILITLESPKPGEKLIPGATLVGAGWAIAPEDIAEIAVMLDGHMLGQARHGLPRPDVARNFPHYRNVDHCGFAFGAQLPADAVISPTSQIGIVVTTVSGQSTRRGVRVGGPLPVAGRAGFPIRLFVEDSQVAPDGTLRLRGWGLSQARTQRVTIHLGDAQIGAAEHGLSRPDIADIYTDYREAAQSGFIFSGSLAGQLPGPTTIRVVLTDVTGQQRQVMVPVMVPGLAGESVAAPPLAARIGATATTASGITLQCDSATVAASGEVMLTGWTLPPGEVRDVMALRGRKTLAVATLGIARPDIARSFPLVAQSGQAGFRCSFTPNPEMSAGDPLTLRLRATDGEIVTLDTTLEPARDAPAASRKAQAALFGGASTRLEIDKPVLAGDGALVPVRGALTVSGWAVAAAGIAGVIVLCDGQQLGEAYVGMRREDIARAYPDCIDSLRAGFALVLPPGAMPDGTHQFTVLATSRDGETQSRSFSVTVEPAGDAHQSGTPRSAMPRAELAFALAVLDSRACHPVFEIAIQGDGDDLAATLAALARQAYADFSVTLASAAGRALAGSLPALAGRLAPTAIADASQTEASGGHARKAVSKAAAAKPALSNPSGEAAPINPSGGAAPVNPGGGAAPVNPSGEAAPVNPSGGAAPINPGGGAAFDAARPRLFMMLVAGDILGCDALLDLAVAFATDPGHGFIYADENRADPVQARRAAFYKPDWSPELLLNMDYIGRPWCAAQAVMDRAGLGLPDLLTRSAYGVVLRLTEAAPRIRHINKVLAATHSSTTAEDAVAALSEAAQRRGLNAAPAAAAFPGTWRMHRQAAYDGLISIIMPTAGTGGLVQRAIESIRATAGSAKVEILVLDNVPDSDRATKAWLKANADRVIAMPGAFNWSRFNNAAVRQAKGGMLLFLNDDIEARETGWLEAMLEHALRPETGVTGARLLYPDGKIQHGGQFLADTHARHAFRFARRDDPGPFGIAQVAREMASVTGACQMVRREVFDRLGGFDEAHDVVNNDLDFCLRAQAAGLAVIYTPDATLMHHELASRAAIEDSFDAERFSGDWRTTLLRGDPFHSRRLLGDGDHYVADPEPVRPVHAGPAGPALGGIARILAVKLDHIGDFLTAIPALRAVRDRFPAARLSVLVPPASAVLARREACIDEVIEFTFFHARSAEGQRVVTQEEYQALGDRLAGHAFDMAIDLRMQPETRPVLRHTGAPFLVGYDRAGAYPWLSLCLEWEGDARLEPKHGHISERLLTLVDAAAAACRPVATPVVPAVRDPSTVPALARLPADFLARRLVCVHPGVGNPVRQWPATSFAALIDLLAAEEDMHAILVGGPDEQDVAREVMAAVAAKDRVVSLVGSLKLDALSDVMQACALFVGNNSGPKHIAAALGVPSLGIHSAVVDAGEWAPLGGAAMALQRQMICGPCYLEFASDCPRALACLTGIKPRDALAACRRLLAARPAGAPAATVAKGALPEFALPEGALTEGALTEGALTGGARDKIRRRH